MDSPRTSLNVWFDRFLESLPPGERGLRRGHPNLAAWDRWSGGAAVDGWPGERRSRWRQYLAERRGEGHEIPDPEDPLGLKGWGSCFD